MNDDQIHIPQWIQDECVRHKGQLTLRVFSIGGDKPIKCNAEFEYQVSHLTGIHDSLVDVAEDLRARLIKAAHDDAKVW